MLFFLCLYALRIQCKLGKLEKVPSDIRGEKVEEITTNVEKLSQQ